MLTSNIINRVFFIHAEQYGTAFTVDVDSKQYIVTARHLLGECSKTSTIKYMHENTWKELPVRIVGVTRGDADIAVLSTDIRLSPDQPLEATSKNMMIGQDVFFVGYPYKMWGDAGSALAGRPCPFIKKGTLSSTFNTGDGVQRLYVDAINNEGFSGGPLIFSTYGTSTHEYRVAGVVSGFRTERETVLDENGEKTKLTVEYNTGFLLAYDINYVIKLIRANPIGLQLS